MQITYVNLRFGYAESRSASSILLRSQELVLETRLDALRSVAKFFFDKYAFDNPHCAPKSKECCVKARMATSNYCPDCGLGLQSAEDLLDYETWLLRLGNSTADDWGSYEGAWDPWTSIEELLCDREHGEPSGVLSFDLAELWLMAALTKDMIPEVYHKALDAYHVSVVESNPANRIQHRDLTLDQILDCDPDIVIC